MSATQSITFVVQDVPDVFRQRERSRNWLHRVAAVHKQHIEALCFVLMSDAALLQFNTRYLDHDTFTDVITFPGEPSSGITGDVLISLDRIRENAKSFGVPLQVELRRVMVHGLLHLLGLSDKTPAQRKKMRQAEDDGLELYLEPS